MSIYKIIVAIIAGLFQGYAGSVVVFKQLKTKDRKQKLKFLIPMWLYSIFCYLFIPNYLRFILFIFVTTLIIRFVLKINDKKILLYAFNLEILVVISEILVSFLLVLCGIGTQNIVNNYFYNLLANILISFVVILLINLKPIKLLIDKLIYLFNKNKHLNIYLYIILVVLYLVLAKNGMELILKSNYYVNIIFFVSIFVVILLLVKSEFKYDKAHEENKQMLNYVTKYEEIITEQGKANHEFKNQLMVIRGYAQMKSDKVIEYIDSIIEETKKTYSSYKISQLNKFPDGGIKGLLYYKISIMVEENIKYELDVETGVKTKLNNLPVEVYKNITKILGVLLDNAIDASNKSKDKKINISVSKDRLYVVFVISNTYNGKLDLNKIGTGYSSKGSNHGYGLRLVKDITEENDSIFNVSTSCDGKFYSTKLTIKISNKKERKSK